MLRVRECRDSRPERLDLRIAVRILRGGASGSDAVEDPKRLASARGLGLNSSSWVRHR